MLTKKFAWLFAENISHTQIMDRMRTGTYFLEMLWYFTADKVVSTAINYYKLDEERAAALRRTFLREADYVIRVRKNLE